MQIKKKLNSDTEELVSRAGELKGEGTTIQNQTDEIKERAGSIKSQVGGIRSKIKDTSIMMAEIQKKSSELSLLRIQIQTEQEKLCAYWIYWTVFFLLSPLLLIGGIWLLRYGFTNWYAKLQTYQDMIVEKEAK